MRFIALLCLIAITVLVGCSSPASPQPVSATVTVAPTAAPAATSTLTPAPTLAPAPTGTPVAQSAAPSSPAAAAPKQTTTIQADDDFFRPDKITITAGTQVTWVNVGQKKHTVTYGTLFDEDLHPGDSFSFTFDKPGTYQYYCVTHSESDTEGMVGTITVLP